MGFKNPPSPTWKLSFCFFVFLEVGWSIIVFGSGALSGKMILVRIVENNKIDDYLGQLCPAGLGKGLG